MAKNSKLDSPMTDHPAAPSARSGHGSFGSGTPKEFSKKPTDYGVISPVQYIPKLGGSGSGAKDSPMNIIDGASSKPKGS